MKFVSRRTVVSAVLVGLAAWLTYSTLAPEQKPSGQHESNITANASAQTSIKLTPPQPFTAATKVLNTDRASSVAEGRLLKIYQLIADADTAQALRHAESLTRDYPNFQLAQLVYGDLLLTQAHAISSFGNVPTPQAAQAQGRITQLQEEAARRIAAFTERPAAGTFPTQFVMLPRSTKHAIAVDAERSRLYVFENGPNGLRLVSDYYASVGKLGTDKSVEGDQRTPLGVYYITSRLDPKQLTDFYGSGALPINYPNEHDRRLGRTGSGIWLHGVPSDSYARSPESTDGCVALANPELQNILNQVQPRTTPVVIAKSLDWVTPQKAELNRENLKNMIEGWRVARSTGDMDRIMSFYSQTFTSGKRNYQDWQLQIEQELKAKRDKNITIKDLAILEWQDRGDSLLVATFGELIEGQRTGIMKRQYWGKEDGLWKIFYEGVIR